MSDLDWKLVLQKYFDKKIQSGNHAYRLLQPVTIRVDGGTSLCQKGAYALFRKTVLLRFANNTISRKNITLR
jgi:hypothetical protein